MRNPVMGMKRRPIELSIAEMAFVECVAVALGAAAVLAFGFGWLFVIVMIIVSLGFLWRIVRGFNR